MEGVFSWELLTGDVFGSSPFTNLVHNIYIYIFIIYMYMYTYICICIHIYIYINLEVGRIKRSTNSLNDKGMIDCQSSYLRESNV